MGAHGKEGRRSCSSVPVPGLNESARRIESESDYDVALGTHPIGSERHEPVLLDWAANSGRSRHVMNSTVRMKHDRTYSDHRLGTAGSGHSIRVHGMGDLDVEFRSDSAENPGKIRTIIVKMTGVLHAPQVVTYNAISMIFEVKSFLGIPLDKNLE